MKSRGSLNILLSVLFFRCLCPVALSSSSALKLHHCTNTLTIPALKMNEITHSATRLNSELVVLKNIILQEFPGENVDISNIYTFLIENYSKAAPILVIFGYYL